MVSDDGNENKNGIIHKKGRREGSLLPNNQKEGRKRRKEKKKKKKELAGISVLLLS